MADGYLNTPANSPGFFIGADPDWQSKEQQVAATGAFQRGVPTDASGNLDYNAMAKALLQKGAIAPATQLMGVGIQQQGIKLGLDAANQLGGTPPSAADPTSAPGSAGAMTPFRNAISGIESGGNYDATGPVSKTGDRPYGKYQVMGANVGPWTKQVLGQAMTPEQFRADPDAQDKVFDGIFGGYVKQFGPAGAASMWHSGRPDSPDVADSYGTRTPVYVSRFMAGLPGASPAPSPQPVAGVAQDGTQAPANAVPLPPRRPTQVAQNDDGTATDAPSGQHPYASPPPVYKPMSSNSAAASQDDGSAAPVRVAGPGAPSPVQLPGDASTSGAPSATDPSLGGLLKGQFVGRPGDYITALRAQAVRLGTLGQTGAAAAYNAQATLVENALTRSETPEIKNYATAVRQGYSGTMMDFARDTAANAEGAKITAGATPAAIRATGQKAQAEAQGKAEAANANDLVPAVQPDGSTKMITKSAALDMANAGNGPVSSLPGYITLGQKALQEKLDTGTNAYQERQVAGERLDAISNLLSTFQSGANSQAFNDAAANLRSFGIPIKNSDTINPAAVQQFAKNAYANVLSTMKEQGNKQFVAEVQSAVNSNPNPDLQPEANAAMVAQMKGIQKYHDANFQDFSNWYGQKANAGASNDAQFQIQWAKDHPVAPFIDAVRKDIAPMGVSLPPKSQLVDGQAYMVRGAGGKSVKARWNASAGGFSPVAGQ